MRLLEILCSRFRQDRRRERPKVFSVLDAAIEDLFHFRTPRIGNNTSISQRARAPFAPALKPAEDFSIGHQGRRLANQFLFRQFRNAMPILREAARINRAANFLARISRSPRSEEHTSE